MSSARQSSRPGLKSQLIFVVAILVLAGGAFYTALVVATQIDHIFFPGNELNLGGPISKLPGVSSGGDGDLGHGRINILVMGIDRRPNEDASSSRTDSMFVLTIDPSTKTARGLAMPRDLWVDIPTKSGNSTIEDRINAAYVIGEQNSYSGGGIGLVKKTVENLLDLKINYYVMIDFEGFKQVIDLLGGIDVDVPADLTVDDRLYSDSERLGDFYPCIFKAGMHHMDSKDALCYARSRNGSDDRERILRQQLVIFAAMDKATQQSLFNDPANLVNLWKRYHDVVKTDINDAQIPGFARLATAIDQNQLAFLSLGAATTSATINGASVLVASPEGIKTLIDAFTSDNRLQEENAMVEVQNGTGREGAATTAIEYFEGLGIPKGSLFASNAAADRDKTVIINFNSKPYTAERLADWLGVARDRIRSATQEDLALRQSPTSDVVVILGTDAKLESAIASR